jgi:pantothenate kinase
MFKFFKQCIFAFRYKRAVRRANSMACLTGLRYFVILINGNIRVVPKKTIKELIHRRRFRSGTTIADIERCALFITK